MPRIAKITKVSKYMCRLMMELSKTRKETTVHNIMMTLALIRDGKPFENLDWLSDVESVMEQVKLRSHTDSTLRTRVGHILSVLGDAEIAPRYKAIFDECKAREKAHVESHEMTEAEKEKLVSYERVIQVRDEYKAMSDAMKHPHIHPSDHQIQQIYLLLLLFTEFPPRRGDYAIMDIVGPMDDAVDATKNYYVVDTQQFVFNSYKTDKQFKQQIFDVPDVIARAIMDIRGPYWKDGALPLLVNQKGQRINNSSSQPMWLTKAFGTPMGPTALRHIVLEHEFPRLLGDMEKRKWWAERMAHSLDQQVDYIKKRD